MHGEIPETVEPWWRFEVSPRFHARRIPTPRLLEHGAPAEHAPAAASSLRLVLGLDGPHTFAQLREHLGLGPELGRDRESHRDLLGHRPVHPVEVPRSLRTQAAPRQQRGQAVDTGPVVDPVDQVVLLLSDNYISPTTTTGSPQISAA